MDGIRRGSRAAMLWTGILVMAVLVTVLVATGSHHPVLARQDGVEVGKEASIGSISPADLPFTLYYTVTFSNSNTTDVMLEVVTDTLPLPAGFTFITVENPQEWPWPATVDGQDVYWNGPITLPATTTLSLVYSVEVADTVPPELEPYVNNVRAETIDGIDLGPAAARVRVGAPDVALMKSVSRTQVEPGGMVSYTVTLENDGFMTATVTTLSDMLDAGLTFQGMLEGPEPTVDGNTLTWAGPITVPPLASVVLVYEVSAAADIAWVDLCNQVEGMADGQPIGPEEACTLVRPEKVSVYLPAIYKGFRYGRLEIERSVTPSPAATNEVVVYTARIENVGDTTGRLLTIQDTLPAGFTFVGMADNSGVKEIPTNVNGTLVWDNGWQMAPAGQVFLAYEVVAAGTPGDHTSSMVIEANKATVPREPALVTLTLQEPIAGLEATNDSPTFLGEITNFSATVTAGQDVVYTWAFGDGGTATGQQVMHIYATAGTHTATVTANNGVSQATDTTVVTIESAMIDEDFEDGWEDWTAFLNYVRLAEGQWYWDSNDGFDNSGGMTQDALAVSGKEAHDALLMYLQPGSENWTDYRMEGKLILRTDEYPHGFWVRGQYQEQNDKGGGWVTGYYIVVGGSQTGSTHYVSLKQLQTTEDCWDLACQNPQNLYDFNNPHELDINIQPGALSRYAWHTLAVEVRGANIKAWLDGVLYIDYTDDEYTFLTGTVGLKTNKAHTVTFDDILVTPLN